MRARRGPPNRAVSRSYAFPTRFPHLTGCHFRGAKGHLAGYLEAMCKSAEPLGGIITFFGAVALPLLGLNTTT